MTRLVPGEADDGSVTWNPLGTLETAGLEEVDAVVHLADENIAAARWNAAVKRRIRECRVHGIRILADALARLLRPSRGLVMASAIGFYGSRGDEWLDKSSDSGTGFLAELARDWEAAARPGVAAGIRMMQLRFGVMLSPRGGA